MVRVRRGNLESLCRRSSSGGQTENGEISAHNSLALDPQHTVPAEQLLALILVQEKNYAEAINHLQNCLTYLPKGSSSDQVKQEIAQLEQLKAGAEK